LSSINHLTTASDTHTTLDAIHSLQLLASSNSHFHVVLLAHVLRLTILVTRGVWPLAKAAAETVEATLGLSYDVSTAVPATTSTSPFPKESTKRKAIFIEFDDPFKSLMAVHTLILSITLFTHVGCASDVSPRLSHLHVLLDSGALDTISDGIAQVSGPCILLTLTLNVRRAWMDRFPCQQVPRSPCKRLIRVSCSS